MRMRPLLLALTLSVPAVCLADAPIIYDNSQQNTSTAINSNASSVTSVSNQQPLVADDNSDQQQSVAAVAPSPANTPVDTSNLSLQQRVSRLEQQMANLQQLNLLNEIQQLHQDIQTLQGTVAEQAHELQQLQSQQQSGVTTTANSAGNSNSASPLPVASASGNSSNANGASPVNSPSANASSVAATAGSAAKNAANSSNATTASSGNRSEATGNAANEQQTYVAAYQLIQNKQYSQAITAMQAYIQQYPKGQYVANAHYWLGEMYALSGDSNKAQTEFSSVAKSYANSDKAPDAMLNLGFIAYDQNQFPQAKQWWQTVVQNYPNSAAARLANQRLQSLEKSGN